MSTRSIFRAALAVTGALMLTTPAFAESLADAMAHAYENNPQIASAFLSVRAAGEGIKAAEGSRLPTIGAEAELGASWNSAANNWTGSDSIGLGYSQTLFDNHQGDAAIAGAMAQYDAAVYGAENAEQNVLLSVTQAYVDVLTGRRVAAIRAETVGFVAAQLQSARDRLEVGEGTQLDVSQAEATLAEARASSAAAVNALRVAEANYLRHVGREAGALNGQYGYSALLPASLEDGLARATAAHPALLATAAQLRAAQYGYEETLAGFGPNLSLNGNVGVGGWTNGTVTQSASISLRLSVPIYTPNRDPAVEQANIGQIQSHLEGLATRDQIVEAVRQGWAGMEAATAQIEAATAAVAAGRIALNSIIEQNEVGQATTLDVLDARASVAGSEEMLISAQAQRVIAAYSLIAATGSLGADELGLPVVPRTAEGQRAVVAAPVDAWGDLR
ncbi:TolC family protein [Pelagibacterium luteolum]|uniref:Outer membrane protein n=1 Tax=Pelagibacterium luteolum TaxID=440168 RepID=A0A1G7S101_9HYPH|nr:TolC family protein [Pelagibacterium luteolum]SDG16712.1 outer membrane protein [Pelagibacterium luteolum]